MVTIAWIGAGSAAFGRTFIGDLLTFPEFRDDATVRLMDVDRDRLEGSKRLAEALVRNEGAALTIEATTDREEALVGADYVIPTIWVGGLEPFENERCIPEKYGVHFSYSGQIALNGAFAALRQTPTLVDIARDMEELCPDAVLLNHTNPVWIIAKVLDEVTDVAVYGFCHSVQGTAESIAEYVDVPVEELDYWVAGINHMAWFLQLEHDGRDVYPDLYEAMADPDVYHQDAVRFEIMDHFGAFPTESSKHNSDNLPYFRTHPELVERMALTPNHYLAYKREDFASSGLPGIDMDEIDEVTASRSTEYAVPFIHSLETGEPRRMNLVVPNSDGLVRNLPSHAAVDVPCIADGAEVHPCAAGELPPQLAALNRPLVAGHELITRALLEKDLDAVRQAIKLDPITSARCTLDEIDQMIDELVEANADYLPSFT